MLIHKYGLVIFFITNFMVMSIWYFLSTLGVLVGTRGLAIFAAPVLLPFLAVSIILTVAATWLVSVPGAFCGIQVILFALREKKIGPAWQCGMGSCSRLSGRRAGYHVSCGKEVGAGKEEFCCDRSSVYPDVGSSIRNGDI